MLGNKIKSLGLSLLFTSVLFSSNLFGLSWQNVGSTGFSAGQIEYTDLEIDSSGNLYAIYKDSGNSGKSTVMKYDGSSWSVVGGAGFSAGRALYTDLEIDSSGNLYAIYADAGNGYKATVMKYDGSSWSAVGGAGFSAGTVSDTDLEIDSSGNLYAIYADVGNSKKATVMKYDGTSWSTVGYDYPVEGNPGLTAAGFSAGEVAFIDLEIDSSGNLYAIFLDVANSYKATVMKYNGGTNWSYVGYPGFSAGQASYTDLEIDSNGNLYALYQDVANSKKATVMKYNGGTSWSAVGGAGFSAGEAEYLDLEIDSSDNLYAIYRDSGNSNKAATVMKYNGTSWSAVGGVGFSAGAVKFTDLEIDSSDNLYALYGDGGLKATTMKYTYPTTTNNLSNAVTENKWSMVSIQNQKNVNASDISGATIWTYNNESNIWEQPTTLVAGKGYWLYTSSSSGYDAITYTSVASTVAKDYITIKSINKNEWTLVGISKSTDGISLVDLHNPTNTLKSGCYSTSIFYYDSANSTWNTTATVPYLGAVWAKQNCISSY